MAWRTQGLSKTRLQPRSSTRQQWAGERALAWSSEPMGKGAYRQRLPEAFFPSSSHPYLGQWAVIVLSPRTAGRQTEQFEVSVTVAPKAKITFELIYQELLRRRLGTYELLLKVKPQQLVKHLQVPGAALSRKPPRFPFSTKAASPCHLASWEHSLLIDPLVTHLLLPDGHPHL